MSDTKHHTAAVLILDEYQP